LAFSGFISDFPTFLVSCNKLKFIFNIHFIVGKIGKSESCALERSDINHITFFLIGKDFPTLLIV